MKIAHILTLWSDNGEYGGPQTVASNLAATSVKLGHEVVVVAGTRELSASVRVVRGFTLFLFPVKTLIPGSGFAGVSSPSLAHWVCKNRKHFDVFHVHAARDLITLPTAAVLVKLGARVVCQTHGMVDASDKKLSKPFDKIFTRSCFDSCHAILALTKQEKVDLEAVGAPPAKIRILPNGVPAYDLDRVPCLSKSPIVCFVSRLHPRKRPAVFAKLAADLISDGTDAIFVIAGPDEGEGDSVRAVVDAVGNETRLRWIGPVDSQGVSRLIEESSLIVLPSINEPYPMVILEAMAIGRPVIVTDSCGLANLVQQSSAGIVSKPDLSSLKQAVTSALSSRSHLMEMGNLGQRAVNSANNQENVTTQLLKYYSELEPIEGGVPL